MHRRVLKRNYLLKQQRESVTSYLRGHAVLMRHAMSLGGKLRINWTNFR